MNQWKRERKKRDHDCSKVWWRFITDMRESTAEAETSERRVHSRHDHRGTCEERGMGRARRVKGRQNWLDCVGKGS